MKEYIVNTTTLHGNVLYKAGRQVKFPDDHVVSKHFTLLPTEMEKLETAKEKADAQAKVASKEKGEATKRLNAEKAKAKPKAKPKE